MRDVYRIVFPHVLLVSIILVCAYVRAIPFAQARPLLVDEVVAVVDLQGASPRRSVLLSEVELSALLHRASVKGAKTLDDGLDRGELAVALSSFIDTLVVVGEAERLEVFRLESVGAEAAVNGFLNAVGRTAIQAWLKRTGREMEAVREFVLRKARVQRYLEGRFRLAARPRPAQVQALWSTRRDEGAFQSFEQARPALELQLEQERFDELVSQFVTDVRRRVRLKILRDFTSDDLDVPVHGTVMAPQTQGAL